MGLFMNTDVLRAGMSYDDLTNAIEQKDYKSEKQKARVQKRLVSTFGAVDKDNDNIISEKEFRNRQKKDAVVGSLIVTSGWTLTMFLMGKVMYGNIVSTMNKLA